jgi:hypothetical protein
MICGVVRKHVMVEWRIHHREHVMVEWHIHHRCVHDAQDTRFSCKVHPDSIVISAGLGGVNGIDASLKEGHPYRKACRPREGASSSLIQVGF